MLQYNLHKSTDIIIDGHVPKFNFIHFFKEERVLQKKVVYVVPLFNLFTYFRKYICTCTYYRFEEKISYVNIAFADINGGNTSSEKRC